MIEEIKIYILRASKLLVLFLQIPFLGLLLGFLGCASVWLNTSWSTTALSTFGLFEPVWRVNLQDRS